MVARDIAAVSTQCHNLGSLNRDPPKPIKVLEQTASK